MPAIFRVLPTSALLLMLFACATRGDPCRLNATVCPSTNPVRAIEWYRRAASQGDAFGQIFLGLMYGRGTGVGRDLEAAKTWFSKAGSQGYFLAAEHFNPFFFLFSE